VDLKYGTFGAVRQGALSELFLEARSVVFGPQGREKGTPLTDAQRAAIRDWLAAGLTFREAAVAFQLSPRILVKLGSTPHLRDAPSARATELRNSVRDAKRRDAETGLRRTHTFLSEGERRHLKSLIASGMTQKEVAKESGVFLGTITSLGSVKRMRLSPPTTPGQLRLSTKEREEISLGIRAGESSREMGRRLGRNPSTISREIGRGGGRRKYRAWLADELATERRQRPKPFKLANDQLRSEVERRLADFWSPQQIAEHLRTDFPGDHSMQVSHETIYASLFVQSRGELRKELTKCLRSGRAHRRPRPTERTARTRLKDMVMISERPAEIEDRAVPGHWEGDLIIGRGGKSAMGTLVERASRFVMLLHLPNGRTAEMVRNAMQKEIQRLPRELFQSLTWDQGSEMAEHGRFAVENDVQVYFCDPHSPWQRGSNENTNGLLRQYFPKGTDLSQHSRADLDRVERSMNGRPRQTLSWRTPSEVLLGRSVALTT
jgi:transposase, IS30 family